MWTRIYLAVLAAAIVVSCFFTYYAWSWLSSIGDPRIAWEAFNYHKRTGAYSLLVFCAILMLVGSIILWQRTSPWALWITNLYFGVFVILLLGVLHLGGTSFCVENNLCQFPSRMVGPVLAAVGIVGLVTVTFLEQYVLARIYAKIHGEDVHEAAEDESSRLM